MVVGMRPGAERRSVRHHAAAVSGVRRDPGSRYRAMKRRLLNFLALCSLLLCVAVAVLWVRSYRVGLRHRRGPVQKGVGSDRVRLLDRLHGGAGGHQAGVRFQTFPTFERETSRHQRPAFRYRGAGVEVASSALPRSSGAGVPFPTERDWQCRPPLVRRRRLGRASGTVAWSRCVVAAPALRHVPLGGYDLRAHGRAPGGASTSSIE